MCVSAFYCLVYRLVNGELDLFLYGYYHRKKHKKKLRTLTLPHDDRWGIKVKFAWDSESAKVDKTCGCYDVTETICSFS